MKQERSLVFLGALEKWPGAACALIAVGLLAVVAFSSRTLAQEAVSQPSTPASQDQVDSGGLKMTRPGVFEQMHFHGADLRLVLQMLSTQGKKNIVATKDVNGTVTADLYDVTFREALDAVVKSSGFVYVENGNLIQVMTPKQFEDVQKSQRKVGTRLFRLAFITANDAKGLIAPAMSKDGVVAVTPASAMGIGTSKVDAGGNTYATDDVLVVQDYEDCLDRVTEILGELDVRPAQVLIEATILRASLNENNALGIDFSTLCGVNFSDFNGVTTGMTSLGLAPAQVANLNDGIGANTNFAGAVPDGGVSIGVITSDAAFFVRALETVTDTTVLANPKLLVVNKQRGEVMVGKREGYLTTTITDTVATQTVQFLETGTRLVVRPFIGKDGFIRMEIHPEDSSGSVELKGSAALPSETTTEVTSNVMVQDGHTIVIGGLFRESSTASRGQVPLVGNVPYVGALFRNTADTTVREEVIILMTPRIVDQENYEGVSEQMKQDVERYRIGARKGLRWWGHDRLVQSHLRWAREELAKGDRSKAMWNVDMALSLQPRELDAITLKEDISNQAYWHDEGNFTAVRFLLERTIMQELGKPVDSVIPPCRPLDNTQLPSDVRQSFGMTAKPFAAKPPLCPALDCQPLLEDSRSADTQPAMVPADATAVSATSPT